MVTVCLLPFRVKARTDYANRACNVTCNVMLVAKLVPRTADEPSTQRTAILCPLMIDCALFYRHRDECLHFITFAIGIINTRRINNSNNSL
jgi:hypothetical protein